MREKIQSLLFDENVGIFNRLRDGKYNISESEKEILYEYAKNINSKLMQKEISYEDVTIILEFMYMAHIYAENYEEMDDVLDQFYEILIRKIPMSL